VAVPKMAKEDFSDLDFLRQKKQVIDYIFLNYNKKKF